MAKRQRQSTTIPATQIVAKRLEAARQAGIVYIAASNGQPLPYTMAALQRRSQRTGEAMEDLLQKQV